LKHVFILPLFLLVCFFAGCSYSSVLVEDERRDHSIPEYSVVTYIHGDSDYLYHTAEGEAVQADEQALDMTKEAAKKASSGEFFIIHQQPKKRFLWLIPRRSSDFYHFRNGDLVNHIRYRSEADEKAFLETEINLFRQIRTEEPDQNQQNYFLYFGHEISAGSGTGYHQSRTDIIVNTETFTHGLKGFLSDGGRYRLVTLSSCSNGTPQMARYLAPFTDHLLASPVNLHLSYIDIEKLQLLETNPETAPAAIAEAMAEQTYARLADSIQTVISLSVYDLQKTSDYIEDFYLENERFAAEHKPDFFRENTDCSELPFFDDEKYSSGVISFYRPPRFGAQASNENHSGWGCKGK
jgi:hypothetical protein